MPSSARARGRLTARFDGPEAVVIAQAPAGFGKTFAMAQWAKTTDSVGIWLRVRENNVDPASLVQCLAQELLFAGLLDTDNPLTHTTEALARGTSPWEILRHGLLLLPSPFIVVLDCLDNLSQETISGLVRLVIDVPSVSMRATVRQSSDAIEPILSIQMDAVTIDSSELALTAEEAAEIMCVDVTSPAVAEIIAGGGLPVIAMMVAVEHRENRAQGLRPERSIPDLVDSFLRVEISTEPRDPRFTRFVTVTSLAEAIAPALAVELLRIAGGFGLGTRANETDALAEAGALLDRANVVGLGQWSCRTHDLATFSITPLIREGFVRRLQREDPQLVIPLTLAIARWELESGRPFQALRRAIEADDWTLAAHVVHQSWDELLRSHDAEVRELFAGTPLAVLRRQPLIVMLLAVNFNRTGHHGPRALEYFALAEHAARAERDNATPARRAIFRTIETAALRMTGRFDAALTAAIDARDILQSISPEDRDELAHTEPTLHNHIGTTFFYSGCLEDARSSFSHSTAVGVSMGARAGLQGMALSAGTNAVSGDIGDARALLAEASQRKWPDGWLSGYRGSFYQLAGALVALESFDADTADSHVRLLDPHRGTIEHWTVLAHVDVLIALLRCEPQLARDRLEREIVHQRRRGAATAHAIARLAHIRSLAELGAGNPSGAERMLGKTQSTRTKIGLARIALTRGQPEDALRHLIRAGEVASGHNHSPTSRSRGESLALRAGALALVGDLDRTAMALRDALVFLTERQQGLSLALVPVDALDALIEAGADAGVNDPTGLLDRARAHAMIPSGASVPTLTPREIALTNALLTTRTTSELAQALSVSPNTIKTQLRGVYRKLGVGSRADAISALSLLDPTARPVFTTTRPHGDPFD